MNYVYLSVFVLLGIIMVFTFYRISANDNVTNILEDSKGECTIEVNYKDGSHKTYENMICEDIKIICLNYMNVSKKARYTWEENKGCTADFYVEKTEDNDICPSIIYRPSREEIGWTYFTENCLRIKKVCIPENDAYWNKELNLCEITSSC